MNRIQLNREQWWLLCASYAAALFLQRDHLREADTATAFLIVGTLLLAWRLNGEKVLPASLNARRPVAAVLSVIAGLFIAALIVSIWPSSQRDAATSSTAVEVALAPAVVSEQADTRATNPEPMAQAPLSPSDLLQEFQTNDYLAGQKYRGRFIQVVGDIATVERGPNEVAFVQLRLRTSRPDFMQAMFPKNPAQIRGVKAGDRVTLSCSPRYDADIDNVTLNDCSLVK